MAQDHSHAPFELDARNPNFAREMLSWSWQVQCEIMELIAATKETIAATKVMIAEADRILACK